MARTYPASQHRETLDVRVAHLAARRYGVFTRSQAIGAGAGRDQVQFRLATGRWERLYEGVYRLAGNPRSWRQDLMAACLAADGSAAASHRAAGIVWRLPRFEQQVLEVTVPRGRRTRMPGVILHQLPLPPVDVTVVDAIPVTTPARTLLDVAGVVPEDVVEEALDDALRRRLVSLSRLMWRLEQLGRRPGVATMRRLLATRSDGDPAPRSVMETRLFRLIRKAKLPMPRRQHPVKDHGRLIAVVDFAYPEARLAIEVDGYRWHSGRGSWQRDLTRRNRLTQLGWHVLHVTSEDIERRAAELTQALAAIL